MTPRQEFEQIFRENITREGADRLLEWLQKTDFFLAPASTRYHNAFEGGLVQHSVNVYKVLMQKHFDEETESRESFAICGLLHDVCKAQFYKVSCRNVKDPATGKWEPVPYYTIEDTLPYGHGEKSAYIVSAYMRLTRDEAFAIRYHMGFSGTEDPGNVGRALEMFPLAYATCCADMEAAFLMEGKLAGENK